GQDAQQSRFSGSVFPKHTENLARSEGEREIIVGNGGTIGSGDVRGFEHAFPGNRMRWGTDPCRRRYPTGGCCQSPCPAGWLRYLPVAIEITVVPDHVMRAGDHCQLVDPAGFSADPPGEPGFGLAGFGRGVQGDDLDRFAVDFRGRAKLELVGEMVDIAP